MEIKDLQPRQGKIDITVDITDKGDVREFDKFGKKGRVCNATAKDKTGEIKLSLWNEQVDQVSVGDKVKITNGYVSEFQGEKQLSTGKFGTLEVLSKGSGTSIEAAVKQEKVEEPEEVLDDSSDDDLGSDEKPYDDDFDEEKM